MKINYITNNQFYPKTIPIFTGLATREAVIIEQEIPKLKRFEEQGNIWINREGKKTEWPDHYDNWVEHFLLDYWA